MVVITCIVLVSLWTAICAIAAGEPSDRFEEWLFLPLSVLDPVSNRLLPETTEPM